MTLVIVLLRVNTENSAVDWESVRLQRTTFPSVQSLLRLSLPHAETHLLRFEHSPCSTRIVSLYDVCIQTRVTPGLASQLHNLGM